MSDKKAKLSFDSIQMQQDNMNEAIMKNSGRNESMMNLIRNATGSSNKTRSVPRLAFDQNPINQNNYAGIYKYKVGLLPDNVIKQIRVQNFLVAAILRSRGNTLSMFGHLRQSRFDVGIDIDVKEEFKDHIEPEQMVKIQERIDRFAKVLINCGYTEGLREDDKMTFPEWLDIQTRNGASFGRFATEFVYEDESNEVFHRFRTADVGTMYRSVKKGEYAEGIRRDSVKLLEEISGVKIDKEMLEQDEYSWIQVIDGQPRQAFTPKELVVYNLYPSSDIEHNGYPVTPLDTVITSITTHMAIEEYNKLYFQNGRANKGMLVIKSDEIDQSVIEDIKQQYNASINNVQNSFRTPIFGVSKDDEVNWVPTVSNQKDGEFQFLFDQTTRNILSAFNMSPDELPGFGHLSRGTNQQGLCLSLSSKITTPEGQFSLEELLGEKEEVLCKVWTGTEFEESKLFLSGKKEQILTKLNNGMDIVTSPDHRFRVVGDSGEPVWKTQKDLTEDDFVLVNKQDIVSENKLPSFNGKEINEDLASLLGWMIGDGCLSVKINKNTQNMKQGTVNLFYHHEKERDIWKNHFEVLESFNISTSDKETEYSEKALDVRKSNIGSENVSKNRITNNIYSNDFMRFLLSVGFTTSKEGKSIPPFLYSAPERIKSSFLRGFFSADGTLKKDAPTIAIHDNRLRRQTKELLMSLGIRTQLSEGLYKIHPVTKIKTKAQTTLAIKDKIMFFEKIGFIQGHKQPSSKLLFSKKTWNKMPKSMALKYIPTFLKIKGLSKCEKDNLRSVLSEKVNRNMSMSLLKSYLAKADLSVPEWMEEFHIEKISEIKNLNEIAPMADIEVFNENHAFIANGMLVHNSESSNEFKLQASRDGGIRPLILRIQDFVNEKLFPIMDKELSQLCYISLSGFDAETKSQESTRIQQDMPIHYDYDQVMEEVDKEQVGAYLGGAVPFNEMYRQITDTSMTVGKYESHFMDSPAAIVDPILKYRRDQFFQAHIESLAQYNPAVVQAYYATRKNSMETLKLFLIDYLEETE